MAKNDGFTTVEGFTNTLTRYEKSMIHLLHAKYGIDYDEFVETCITAVKKNPALLLCDRASLIGCVLLCASVGLKPNTPDGHCYIYPRGGEATFQVGYQGIVELMYRNPRVKKIMGEVVFEKDDFDYELGLEPFLKHKPCRDKDRGELSAVYCIVKLDGADPIFTVVEKFTLKEIEKLSPAIDSKHSPYNNGTDVNHFMQIKAAIKKISKLIPKQDANALGLAIDLDSKFEGGSKVRINLNVKGEEVVSPEIVDGKKNTNSLSNAFDDDDSSEVLEKVKESTENLEKEKVKANTASSNQDTKEAKTDPPKNKTTEKSTPTPPKKEVKETKKETIPASGGEINFEDVSEDVSDTSTETAPKDTSTEKKVDTKEKEEEKTPSDKDIKEEPKQAMKDAKDMSIEMHPDEETVANSEEKEQQKEDDSTNTTKQEVEREKAESKAEETKTKEPENKPTNESVSSDEENQDEESDPNWEFSDDDFDFSKEGKLF